MGEKILIVDDDQFIRELYAEVLYGEGYDIQTAIDGEDGLAKLQKGGFDLVLLDIMMPKMDGLQVLDALSKHPPESPNGPIIVLTNISHDPIIEDAAKKGSHAYLVKAEITPAELSEHVKKYLKEAKIPDKPPLPN